MRQSILVMLLVASILASTTYAYAAYSSPDAVFVCSAYSDKTVYADHVDHMASSSTSETVDEIQARTTLYRNGSAVDGSSSTVYDSWDAAVYDTYTWPTAGYTWVTEGYCYAKLAVDYPTPHNEICHETDLD